MSRNPREALRDPGESMMNDESLDRARRRIAEIRALQGDDDDLGEGFVDKWYALAPAGWTYEWKTHSVWNKEYPQYFNALLRNGWSAVPASRHRDLVYAGYENENIIIDGMILMERPRELTEKVRRRDIYRATDQVRSMEAKLNDAPPGTPPRNTTGFTRTQLSSHIGPVIQD